MKVLRLIIDFFCLLITVRGVSAVSKKNPRSGKVFFRNGEIPPCCMLADRRESEHQQGGGCPPPEPLLCEPTEGRLA